MKKKQYLDYFLISIILVIVVMVLVFGTLYRATKENLINIGNKKSMQSSQEVRYYLVEAVNEVSLAAEKIDMIKDNDGTKEDILNFLIEETNAVNKALDENYTGLYGYFDGEYLDGTMFVPEDGYVVEERPWYKAAIRAKGEVTMVSPYLDVKTHTVMISVCKMLKDKKSVISLDLAASNIQAIAEKLVDDSAIEELIIDESGFVIANSDSDELGKAYSEEKDTFGSKIYNTIFDSNKTDFEISYGGKSYMIFVANVNDNWKSVTVMDSDELFRPLQYIYFGTVIVVILVVVLVGIVFRSINKSSKELEYLNKQLESLADVYVSLHELDFRNNSFVEIRAEKFVSDILNASKGGIKEKMDLLLEGLVDEQSYSLMEEFTDISTLKERLNNKLTITQEFLSSKGWIRARYIVVNNSSDGDLGQILWMLENIDEEKRKQAQLLYLSETDLMTGIRNRGSGEFTIRNLISSGKNGMFCLIDVDDFKSVNDNFGHGVGDKVIIRIAETLKKSFRDRDVVMRLGGDEFAVFATDVLNEEIGTKIVERFFEEINNINISEIGERKICVSMGATFYNSQSQETFEKVYKRADEGTYESKKQKGCYVTFVNENI